MTYAKKSGGNSRVSSVVLAGTLALGMAHHLRAQDSVGAAPETNSVKTTLTSVQAQQFHSRADNYTLPLDVGKYAAVAIMGDLKGMSKALDLAETNSIEGKWTYVALVPDAIDYPKSGWDSYVRIEGISPSMVTITWMPRGDADTNGMEAPTGAHLYGPAAEIAVNGSIATMTRYKDDVRCHTLVELDRSVTHYEIQLDGPDFAGPDNSAFTRILNRMTFTEPVANPAQAASTNQVPKAAMPGLKSD
jgi:hypothetical protein